MTPFAAYQSALHSGRFDADPAQSMAAEYLSELQNNLATPAARPLPSGFFRIPWRKRPEAAAPVSGLYLWGGVGRGKTWLMDLFFDVLPFDDKRRVHFHSFMQAVHQDLDRLKGQAEPLDRVAANIAAETRLLCLDEMQVNDITDAMIMAGLLKALFQRGVTLVTTSNVPPDGLYRAGLQRDRFLPAIALMQQHCRVMELTSPTDFRLRRLQQAQVYLSPPGTAADTAMAAYFNAAVEPKHQVKDPVDVNNRDIPVVARGDGAIWFDFDVICHIPRSKNDYVEVARCYHTVLLSNVRRLTDEQSNIAHRLITLIDAVYDRQCKLMISAETEPAALYQGRDMAFEFRRTLSRLIEMRSEDYLARPHLA